MPDGETAARGRPDRAASSGHLRAPTDRAASPRTRPRSVGCIEVARAGDTVIFRVVGLGSVANAGTLWQFAERSLGEGWRRFALDLAECTGLDSTFLGSLVGLSQEIASRERRRGRSRAEGAGQLDFGELSRAASGSLFEPDRARLRAPNTTTLATEGTEITEAQDPLRCPLGVLCVVLLAVPSAGRGTATV